MRNQLDWIICLFLICASVATSASDVDQLSQGCDECHGTSGVSAESDIPSIAGLSSVVLEENLIAFQANERPCAEREYISGDKTRPPTTMCKVVVDLTDEEIEALAVHYESLPFVPAKQPFDTQKAALGKRIHDRNCDKCHTEGGGLAIDDVGLLAGRWLPYLESAMREIQAGERPMPEEMTEQTEPLGEDQVSALLHYYASQQ